MKYFYFGTLPLFNVSVHENRVNVADSPIKEMIYVTHINTNNMFLLKSYNFNTLICHASCASHLEKIKSIRRTFGMLNTHIIASHMDKADVLFTAEADTDLGITVHFLDEESKLEHLVNRLLSLEV